MGAVPLSDTAPIFVHYTGGAEAPALHQCVCGYDN